jgi:SSS family solute:Na+ symporter
VLAAQTDRDAKLGSILAGFLKLIIPFFSIAAGTAAFYLFKARFGEGVIKPDDTFLTLLKTVVPIGYGFVGLILAGLLCAIFSAIYSMMNSVSTMMAFDVYKKYISPNANDKMTVRFGQFFVVVMCGIAIFLANTTYDPNSKDNFFLILANQTSYIKPGLVVAFFWGVLWQKTNAKAAVIALVAAPFIGLGCDWLYENVLTNIGWIRDIFGEKLNFLYRVFMIFVLGSGLIYGLSKYFNKQDNVQHTNDLSVSLSGIGKVLLPFVAIHTVLILLTLTGVLSPQMAAYPAAALTFLGFVGILKKEKTDLPFYQSDIFYAGLLSTAMVWIMYFFA